MVGWAMNRMTIGVAGGLHARVDFIHILRTGDKHAGADADGARIGAGISDRRVKVLHDAKHADFGVIALENSDPYFGAGLTGGQHFAPHFHLLVVPNLHAHDLGVEIDGLLNVADDQCRAFYAEGRDVGCVALVIDLIEKAIEIEERQSRHFNATFTVRRRHRPIVRRAMHAALGRGFETFDQRVHIRRLADKHHIADSEARTRRETWVFRQAGGGPLEDAELGDVRSVALHNAEMDGRAGLASGNDLAAHRHGLIVVLGHPQHIAIEGDGALAIVNQNGGPFEVSVGHEIHFAIGVDEMANCGHAKYRHGKVSRRQPQGSRAMSHKNWIGVTLVLLGGLALSSCGEEAAPISERIRAIKPYYVSDPAGSEVRRYAGSIAASDTSSLSFPVAGTVQTVDVSQGDPVERGQVLATLDPERFELDVTSARSQLQSAEADRTNKLADLERKKDLLDKGWVAQAAYDQAIAAFDSAEGNLNLARSRLSSAQRDLRNTTLIAPFDGVIAARSVEPFTEATPSQALFEINSEGALEVTISVPDSIIGRFSVGLPVTVDAANDQGCGCTGRVTEIGSVAGAANAVNVKVALLQAPSELLPGMAAEVTVVLNDDGLASGYLLPLVAIAPGPEMESGFVFKYDENSQTVKKTLVRGRAGRDNLIAVTEGIGPGDIVAAAGVSFLEDGQKVTVMGQ